MRFLGKDLRLQDVTLIYIILLAALVVLLVAPYHASSPSSSTSSPTLSPDSPSRPSLPYHVPLDPAGQLEFFWNLSYSKQEVYMELRAKELRHGVLLGMSDRGEPTNADLVLLWSDGHKSYFGVRVSLGNPTEKVPKTYIYPDVSNLHIKIKTIKKNIYY